jgi:SAM-dependent methyltransferase
MRRLMPRTENELRILLFLRLARRNSIPAHPLHLAAYVYSAGFAGLRVSWTHREQLLASPTGRQSPRPNTLIAMGTSAWAAPRPPFPRAILVCPVCQGQLCFSPRLIRCSLCSREFPQEEGEGAYNLMPESFASGGNILWSNRLQEMERWYEDLMSSPAQTINCFSQDYQPFSAILASFRGHVLDLGGGTGIVRHYLPPSTEYLVADPSLTWRRSRWSSLAEQFPCLATQPNFIRAVGEYLPFPDGSFDAALSFWSLNHVDQPERVLQEVGRVLKPEGRFLIVLEDMPPVWYDWPRHILISLADRYSAKRLISDLWTRFRTGRWPLQTDHIRIQEADLRLWSHPHFTVHRRSWIHRYLAYDLRKRQNRQDMRA